MDQDNEILKMLVLSDRTATIFTLHLFSSKTQQLIKKPADKWRKKTDYTYLPTDCLA